MDFTLKKAYDLLAQHKIVISGLHIETREELDMKFNNKAPNPGSDEAQAVGCKCPVMDNCRGKGYLVAGSGSFCVAEHCPIHGKAAQNEDQAKTEER